MRDVAGLVRPLIRDVADFPQPGVLFRDLSLLFADAAAFRAVVDALAGNGDGAGGPDGANGADGADVVAGVEARGFLLGAAVAYARGLGVIAVRKPGKLPVVAHREDYELEYAATTLELADGVLRPGTRVLVVDDVLATGGTLAATCALVAKAGAEVTGLAVVLELAELGGRGRLGGHRLRALLTV